jgi:hypothetical protein
MAAAALCAEQLTVQLPCLHALLFVWLLADTHCDCCGQLDTHQASQVAFKYQAQVSAFTVDGPHMMVKRNNPLQDNSRQPLDTPAMLDSHGHNYTHVIVDAAHSCIIDPFAAGNALQLLAYSHMPHTVSGQGYTD